MSKMIRVSRFDLRQSFFYLRDGFCIEEMPAHICADAFSRPEERPGLASLLSKFTQALCLATLKRSPTR